MVGMGCGQVRAFAEAVDELSVAFAEMDGRKSPKQQGRSGYSCPGEITGKLCADCDGCVVCLKQRNRISG